IKPILGCEVYVARTSRFEKKDRGDHLILLAKNIEGYHNLIKMASYAFTEGYYYHPRIDKELLHKYSEGLICCSACLGGEIPQAIMAGDIDRAREVIKEFKGVFGEDYYLEMQKHRSGEPNIDYKVYNKQLEVNKIILELAAEHNVKVIASNDVHYIRAEDATAHDHLICLNTGRDLDDPTRMRYTSQEYLKSADEMAALFPESPEALENTMEIVAKIEEYSLDHGPLMPNFPIPDDFEIDEQKLQTSFLKKLEDKELIEAVGKTDDLRKLINESYPSFKEKLTIAEQFLYLCHLSYVGARERYGDNLSEDIVARIEFELGTIEWMGFPGYFLIVWDFIREARDMNVSVGPGRGSAAGSVVAYCLRITNIDPIKYDLLFERFLNPDRISLPDVDIDFDEDGRAKVLQYVINKYGHKRVAQIVTFGTMAPKMAIRDVARIQKLNLRESDRLAKLVPEHPGVTFPKAYKESPELANEKDSNDPLIQNTLKYAEQLEGSIRQTGVHACGVIIGQDDLEKFAPVATAKDAELNVVQFEGKLVESVGLIKMDFLGLKTLSIIKDAVANVKESKGIDIDIEAIPLDDAKTFELYSNGETTGLFQFESPGMKKYLRQLKPSRLEDLIAMNALYRPGPIEYIPNFIARKQGTEKVAYDIAEMEEYLKDTYGITVYQEQVMLLSQKLAGFTKGEADSLRKAMGKKQKAVLDKMRPKFLKQAVEKGHDEKICEKVWADWEAFASYAFNKSHSTCYAYVSYQTAYLKAQYPAEFMAALLSRNLSDIKKISIFMDECKHMGISVKGPDVNLSRLNFSVDKQSNVRFGLAAIKGVGGAAVQSIINEREKAGPFKSIFDFVERVSLQSVNKKTLENLATGGAFDELIDFPRSAFFATSGNDNLSFIEQLIRYGNRIQVEKLNSQQSLFGGESGTSDIKAPVAEKVNIWSKLEMLKKERELIGMYLSAHPLDDYKIIMDNFCNISLGELDNLEPLAGRELCVAGMVVDAVNLSTSKGQPFGRLTIEDYKGSYTFSLFGKDYEDNRKFFYNDYLVLIKLKVQAHRFRKDELEIKINPAGMTMLHAFMEQAIKEFIVTIPIEDINKETIKLFDKTIKENEGGVVLKTKIVDRSEGVSLDLYSRTNKIAVNQSIIDLCEQNEWRYLLV
ncbi:MAG: DNA polymerase III subunit alpha, partial [Rikenellaceae bacterium]